MRVRENVRIRAAGPARAVVELGRGAVEMLLAASPGPGFDLDAARIEEDCGAGAKHR